MTRAMGAAPDLDFNPRSPWGERPPTCYRGRRRKTFQSTLPVGGATSRACLRPDLAEFQSTLPVGGATRWTITIFRVSLFQSTLPVGGATAAPTPKTIHRQNFNPRSPWGERPARWQLPGPDSPISIHAPRGGSDGWRSSCLPLPGYFNPRSPWGERL